MFNKCNNDDTEEKRVSDFGLMEFLRFLIPLDAMKEDKHRSEEDGREIRTFGFSN